MTMALSCKTFKIANLKWNSSCLKPLMPCMHSKLLLLSRCTVTVDMIESGVDEIAFWSLMDGAIGNVRTANITSIAFSYQPNCQTWQPAIAD